MAIMAEHGIGRRHNKYNACPKINSNKKEASSPAIKLE